jgi:hypothetical protein
MPATWGQKYIYRIIRSLQPRDAHINVELPIPLGDDVSLSEALLALRAIVEKYESFRSTYTEDGTDVVQHLTDSLVFDVDVWDCGARAPKQVVGELLARYTRDSIDPAEGPLFRSAVVTSGGRAHHIVLVTSHMVLDDWSGTLVEREVAGLLSGRPGTSPEWHPFEQAAWEASEAGQRLHARSVAHWRRAVDDGPYLRAESRPDGAERPRYWHGQLTSPASFAALDRRAAELGVSGPSLFLAAYGLVFGRHFKSDDVMMMVRTANRPLRETLTAVGHFSQQVPLRLRVTQSSFAEYVRDVHARALDAYPSGASDPDEVAVDLWSERANHWNMLTVNITPDVPADPGGRPGGTPGRRERTRAFTWLEQREEEQILAYSNVWPAIQTFSLFADTAYIGKEAVVGMLEELEGIVAGDDERLL